MLPLIYSLFFWLSTFYSLKFLLSSSSRPADKSADILSCIHATISLTWSIAIIVRHITDYQYDHVYTDNKFTSYNLFLFGMGYYMVHTFYLSVYSDKWSIFILHHMLAIVGLVEGYLVEDLAVVFTIIYVLGEFTNPLHLTWELSKKYGYLNLHRITSLPFTYLFLGWRCCIAPIVSIFLFYWILYLGPVRSSLMTASFIIEGSLMNLVSMWWGYRLYIGYLKICQRRIKVENYYTEP